MLGSCHAHQLSLHFLDTFRDIASSPVHGASNNSSSMSAQPTGNEMPSLPPLPSLPDTEAIGNNDATDMSSFTKTLVRLGDAAGSTPAIRVQLVADGVLARITKLLKERSQWLLRATAGDISEAEGQQIDVGAQCLRVCGNSCIDCDVARDELLRHDAFASILTCLRCLGRIDVLKFSAGALANLICAHEVAQRAFMDSHATNTVVPVLNNTMSATLHLKCLRCGTGQFNYH